MNVRQTTKNLRARTRGSAFVVLVLLTVVALLVVGFRSKNATGDSEFLPLAVSLTSIESVVTAQGKLEPMQYVDLGAQVSGQLRKLHVEIGDSVSVGDLIAEIDPELYLTQVAADEARLQTLQAQLLEADAQEELASLALQRSRRLIGVNAISQESLEQAVTSQKVAQAKRTSLKAQINEARSTLEGNKAKLNYTKLFAPIAGTIVAQIAREGETLNANQTTPTIVQIANLDIMTVRAQVAEADIPRIEVGMPLYFTTLGSRNRRWEAEVRQILPTPEIINDVILFNVLADVDNADHRLMSSMTAQLFFVLGKAVDVPTIPVSALRKRMESEDNEAGSAYRVYIPSRNGYDERIVHVGLQSRQHAEIRAGLSVGDLVLIDATQSREDASSTRRRTPRL